MFDYSQGFLGFFVSDSYGYCYFTDSTFNYTYAEIKVGDNRVVEFIVGPNGYNWTFVSSPHNLDDSSLYLDSYDEL